MTYFNKQWQEEVLLPDGTKASCQQDVDKFLRASGLARTQDYSDEYRSMVRLNNEREERKKLFLDFIRNYKRSIWYEKK